jgi:hypothetical protein
MSWSFQIAAPEKIRYNIFDAQGRKVLTGDKKDVDGSGLANGYYIFCSEVNGESNTQKILVLH